MTASQHDQASRPLLTLQPLSQTVIAGTNLTLAAAAIGSPPLHYQWRHNDAPVSANNSPVLTVPNIQAQQSGNYVLLVSNVYGVAISSNALITVTESAPYILLQPTNTVGYPGGSEIDLAVEKGEVQCRGLTAAPFFGREPFISWRKKNFVNVLLYGGLKRDPRIPDTPTIYEIFDKLHTPDESRQVADVILRGGDFGRPWVMPPETPAEVVKTMRAAYGKAMADRALLDEAKKTKLDVEYVPGEDLQKLAEKMMSQPPGVVKRVKKLLGTK